MEDVLIRERGNEMSKEYGEAIISECLTESEKKTIEECLGLLEEKGHIERNDILEKNVNFFSVFFRDNYPDEYKKPKILFIQLSPCSSKLTEIELNGRAFWLTGYYEYAFNDADAKFEMPNEDIIKINWRRA